MTAGRHHTTGERFRDMTDDTLRKVMRRTYRMAADNNQDARAAQNELRRRKTIRGNKEI